ncbi:hypothetical protein VQE80_13715 [Staphylococcus shinii]|uniref:hypothetical protein n=1 Tax=Staphylococcus shinii TaxID=2912228 RepID=UPI003F45DBAE
MSNSNNNIDDSFFSMKKFIGDSSESKKEILIAIAVTIYLVIKSFVTQEYIYILTYFDISKTLQAIGDVLNDLILAYIPIGILVLTFEGTKYEGSSIKERLKTAMLAIVAIPIFILMLYFAIWFDTILPSTNYTGVIAIIVFIFTALLKSLILIIIVSMFIMCMSVMVSNIITSIFIYLKNINKDKNTISIEEDIYVDNNYINIYNFWYRYNYNPSINPKKHFREVYYIKVYIKSHKENKAILNIYDAGERLIKPKKETQIKLINQIKEVELEDKLKPIIKNVVENHKMTKQS